MVRFCNCFAMTRINLGVVLHQKMPGTVYIRRHVAFPDYFLAFSVEILQSLFNYRKRKFILMSTTCFHIFSVTDAGFEYTFHHF